MIQISILEDDDIILACDYCRPLSISYDGDCVFTKATYSGTPINNMKWVEVRYVLGPCWYGKPVNKYNIHPNNPFNTKYEFARGFLPKEHLLNVKDFKHLDLGGK